MANIFGATSSTEEVLSGINLQGKRVLVTGVSAGIGVETARSLAAHGAQVVGAARRNPVDEDKVSQVIGPELRLEPVCRVARSWRTM